MPDNGIVYRLATFMVPDDSGFTLVGNTDAGECRGACARLLQNITGDLQLLLPDFPCIVLDPTGLREDLCKLLPDHGNTFHLAVIENGS